MCACRCVLEEDGEKDCVLVLLWVSVRDTVFLLCLRGVVHRVLSFFFSSLLSLVSTVLYFWSGLEIGVGLAGEEERERERRLGRR